MNEIKAFRIKFNGKKYQILAGLPIGHPWSPILAEFLVGELEQKFMDRVFSENIEFPIIFLRYMDDTLFCFEDEDVDRVKNWYEQAISPYKVEWDDMGSDEKVTNLKFLDSEIERQFDPEMVMEKFMDFSFNEERDLANRPTDSLDFIMNFNRFSRTIFHRRQVVMTKHEFNFHWKNLDFPMGFVPDSVVISTFVNKSLRLISVMISESKFQWDLLYALLKGSLKLSDFDKLRDRFIKLGYGHLLRRISKLVWRHISPSFTRERKLITLPFSPKYLTNKGKMEVSDLQKDHTIRWDLANAKRSMAILGH